VLRSGLVAAILSLIAGASEAWAAIAPLDDAMAKSKAGQKTIA